MRSTSTKKVLDQPPHYRENPPVGTRQCDPKSLSFTPGQRLRVGLRVKKSKVLGHLSPEMGTIDTVEPYQMSGASVWRCGIFPEQVKDARHYLHIVVGRLVRSAPPGQRRHDRRSSLDKWRELSNSTRRCDHGGRDVAPAGCDIKILLFTRSSTRRLWLSRSSTREIDVYCNDHDPRWN